MITMNEQQHGGASAGSSLPPKLEAVLAQLCEDGQLNVTQAVKLTYLVDVVAEHVLGRRITEGRHKAFQHGVVTSEAWRHLNRLGEGPSLFRLEPYDEERKVKIVHEPPGGLLTEEERQVVACIRAEFGRVRASELGLITKRMNPTISSWGSGRLADTGEDAYDRMSPEYQEMARAVDQWTVEELARQSMPIADIEEAIA